MMWKSLRDLTPEQLEIGISKFCKIHKDVYPGTNVMAYIREYALDFDQLPTSTEAWESVRMAVRRKGGGTMPEFKSEIVSDTVKSFGWTEICNSTNPEATRAHFMRMYDEKLERHKMQMRNTGGK